MTFLRCACGTHPSVVVAVGAILCLAGCQSDDLARRDSLGFGAGDAVQTNIATHVIDPWPRASRELYAPTSGERMQRAVERYRTGAQTGAAQQSGSVAAAVPTTNSSGLSNGSGFGSGSGLGSPTR